MRFLQRLMSLPGRRLVLVLLLFAAGSAAQAQNYRIAFGPDSSSTDPEGCAAAGAKWYPTAAEACQGATTALPLCDRNTATYRGYVAQLTSPTLCYVQWEYLNNGTTSWSSWSGTYGITVERAIDIYRDIKQPPKCPMKVGNPIYPLTGGKQEFVETGLAIGGQSLELTYNSTRATAASAASRSTKDFGDLPAFGALWLSSLHRRLLIADSGFGAKLFRGDGTVVQFLRQGGVFVADGDVTGQLTSVSGAYRYVDAVSQSVETYNSSGQLISLVDTVGNALTYSYSMGATSTAPAAGYLMQVTDHAGRSVRFEYALPSGGSAAADGRVSRIIDATGQVIAAGYDLNGNLVSLTWMDGKVRQFLYENQTFSWALTGVVDENNSRYATFTYDDAGRAISTGYIGGVNQFTVSYGTPPAVVITEVHDTANNILYRYHDWQAPSGTTLLTPAGQNVELNATSILGAAVLTSMSQPAGSGCSASSGGLAYDANGNVLSRDDFQGNRTCYAYDSSNRETVRVEGLANTVDCTTVTSAEATLPAGARKISTTWHPDWRLPTKLVQTGRITTTVYHGQPDPFNNSVTASCSTAPSMPNGKPLPLVCKEVLQASLEGSAPPSTYDGSFNFVGLLMHMDGSNNSIVFADSSAPPKSFTVNGAGKIVTAQSVFGGASAYFDGASWLSTPASSDFNPGSGDFSVELYAQSTGPLIGQNRDLFGQSTSYGGNVPIVIRQASTGRWQLAIYDGSSYQGLDGGPVISNQWTHLAMVKKGASVKFFVNGVNTDTVVMANGGQIYVNATDSLSIGRMGSYGNHFIGYIDELRFTKGVARYSADFAPPNMAFANRGAVDTTIPDVTHQYAYDGSGHVLTQIDANNRATSFAYYSDTVFTTGAGGHDPYYDNVSLLLHGNGANGVTTFSDDSPNPKNVVAVGSAMLSTAQGRFGGSSIYLSGAGDYATVAPHADFALGTGDFTMEAWVYLDGNSPASPGDGLRAADILSNYTDTNLQGTFAFYVNGSTTTTGTGFGLSVFDAGVYKSIVWTGTISQNAWHHYAVARIGGVVSLYLDGEKVTATDGVGPSSLTASSRTLAIGRALHPNYPRNLKGYIDDLRITKGVGRYTASFTAPAAEFPNIGPIPSPTDVGHTVGDLQSITNPAGHVTQFTQYDRAGRIRQMIDPKGVVTDIAYTPRGWVSTVTTTVPGGSARTTTHSYDGVGQLTGVTQPDGTTLSYSYDAAHRLVGVTDAKGNSVNYTLDNVGNRINEEIKDPTGTLQRSISRSFDALNRLQQVTGAAR